MCFNSLTPGRFASWWLMAEVSLVKFPSGDCNWTSLITRTPAFWGYPPPPHIIHIIESYWVILDPKSKEDKIKVTNLKNLPKFHDSVDRRTDGPRSVSPYGVTRPQWVKNNLPVHRSSDPHRNFPQLFGPWTLNIWRSEQWLLEALLGSWRGICFLENK